MLDLKKINKIKAMKPARKAKEALYQYAVGLGLQEGIKQTFHISKMIEIMEKNDIIINSDNVKDKLSAGTLESIDNYNEELNKVVPEFVDRLNQIKDTEDEDKIEEEELIQEISLRRNIPCINPIDKNPSYFILPYWIYDYIIKNPSSWYRKRPTVFIKDKKSYDIALSLIYLIRKDGAVTVRETRFSAFHTFIKG